MSDSKRKANGAAAAAAHDVDDRAAKRRRGTDNENGETPEATTQVGLEFLEHIKKVQDKGKRLVATNFLTLPNRRDFPEYYKVIKQPIALDTIEQKLQKREFANLTELESYFKKMVGNAKEFNERGSEIYEDAERLRKALSNFMTRSNPALKAVGYAGTPRVARPEPQKTETPATKERPPRRSIGSAREIKRDVESDDSDDEQAVEEATPARRSRGRPTRSANATAPTPNARAANGPSEDAKAAERWQGLTFQQAQEKILAELMSYKENEDDDFIAFEPFVVLPSRSLRDYYQVISHPVSLNSLAKTVKGQHGRQAIAGVTPFKTWAQFEDEASMVWKNAFTYNEDGSEISQLAKELKDFFMKRLNEAKKYVPEPSQPKIKLKVNSTPSEATTPKITLRMGGVANSQAESPAPTPDATNGTASPSLAGRKTVLASRTSSTPGPNNVAGSAASPTPTAPAVKNEEGSRQPSAPVPATAANAQPTPPQVNGTATPVVPTAAAAPAPILPPVPAAPAKPTFDSKWRQPGKGLSDALITSLRLSTHPGLNLSSHMRVEIPASPILAQQSLTINLPGSHYYLQIKPTIAPSVFERQYKLFVTAGNQRLHAVPAAPGLGVDPRSPTFEARLIPGVNRIEVELITTLPKGVPKPSHGQDIELEKFTVFANLSKP